MANTIATNSTNRGQRQFQGSFTEVWTAKATISDQDSISAGDTIGFDITVPGVALGDMVLGISLTNDLSDGTDQAVVTGVVTAANTVTVRVQADVGAYAADDLNSAVVKVIVGRPAW